MYFAVICIDKKDSGELRTATRPAHLDYLQPFLPAVLFAGPFLAPGTEHSTGGLIVIDLPDHEAALAFARQDPYALAGLFQSVEVLPWRKVFG